MGFQTVKRATAKTPQLITLIIDDSGSMRGTKADQVQQAIQDLVVTLQAGTFSSSGWRFLVNIAKFDYEVTPLATATPPLEIDLGTLVFSAERGGTTDMALALEWVVQAVQTGLAKCRSLPGYNESQAPNPLCVFFSDGENTGDDVTAVAQALKDIPFQNGNVDVIACGIGMQPNHFPVMQQIASQPDFAFNIQDQNLEDFIGEIGATATGETDLRRFVEKGREM